MLDLRITLSPVQALGNPQEEARASQRKCKGPHVLRGFGLQSLSRTTVTASHSEDHKAVRRLSHAMFLMIMADLQSSLTSHLSLMCTLRITSWRHKD
jgi:hypothetical protein